MDQTPAAISIAEETPAPANPAETAVPAATGGHFFQEAHRLMKEKGCTLSLILVRTDDGQVRLTLFGHSTESDEKKSGEKDQSPPFKPISLVATPEEFDAEEGLGAYLRQAREHHHTLAEARRRADKAHEQAVAAEKAREKKAKEKRKAAAPEGPLFSKDD